MMRQPSLWCTGVGARELWWLVLVLYSGCSLGGVQNVILRTLQSVILHTL